MEKKYYVIKNMMLANTLTFITGQMPYIYRSNIDEKKKVWSFINDEKFREGLKSIIRLRDNINQ